MGNGVIAFLVSISAVVFVYAKMMRKTGNNASSAAIVAGVAGVVSFIAMLLLLGFIPE